MIVDPFGDQLDAAFGARFPGAGRPGPGQPHILIHLGSVPAGIAPLADDYWDRIHDIADDFRAELSARLEGAALPIPTRHLRLSTEHDSLITELESELLERLSIIEWLCDSPHTELRFDSAVTPIDRSRRAARAAVAHLASHSEDWLRVTKRGPIPKNLLSQFREEEVAIYENRMVSTLVDGCIEWLVQTEHILTEKVGAEKDRLDLRNVAYFQRFERLGHWLDEADGHTELEKLAQRRQVVEDLLRSLIALDASVLREGTRAAAPVDGLHITNLLSNEGRYRQMVELWYVWLRQITRDSDEMLSEEDRWRRRFRDLDAYCRLLATRSLEEVGAFDSGTLQSLQPDIDVEIGAADIGSIVRIRHRSGAELSIHFSAVAASLGVPHDSFDDTDFLDAYLSALASRADSSNEIRCLLHTVLRSGIDAEEQGGVRTLGVDATSRNGSAWRSFRGLVVLPIHPMSVDCLEHLARLVRLAIGMLRARAFPPRTSLAGGLELLPTVTLDVAGSGLEVEGKDLVLIGPTIDIERLTTAPRINGKKQPARPQDEADWTMALHPLDLMREGLLTCPTFPNDHRATSTTVEFWNRTGYRARCGQCASIWGIRTCTSCESRYPFMLFESDTMWAEAEREHTGSAEYFGMDLMAQPCPADRNVNVCPVCFACPNAARSLDCGTCTTRTRDSTRHLGHRHPHR